MESDIILEGFKKEESMHGAWYTRSIGDGDSSYYSTLTKHAPVSGTFIKTIECANRFNVPVLPYFF